MNKCPQCGAHVAPNSRFCTECGKPMPVAGHAPVPPVPHAPGMPPGQPMMGHTPPPNMPVYVTPPTPQPPMPGPQGMPPRPPVPGPQGMPPRPPVPGPQGMPPQPPVHGPQGMPPQPPTPQPTAVPVSPLSGYAALPAIRVATAGDLLNNGTPIGVIVTDDALTLLTPNGPIRTEQIPGIRQAIVGDYDGDGTDELAIFTETQMWVLRFGEFGSIPSGRVTLNTLPENLTRAPYTSEGRAVLMSAEADRIAFYVINPARGLVEIAATPAPAIEA